MKNKPRILVSSCLLGQNVRYDGYHKFCPPIIELQNDFEIIPICPEMAAGLGAPRPPINLHFIEKKYFALGAEGSNLDVTEKLKKWIEQFFKNNSAHGAILKSKSPSCGFKTTPIHTKNSQFIGSGLFTSALVKNNQGLPIIDEINIYNMNEKKQFIKNIWRQFNVS